MVRRLTQITPDPLCADGVLSCEYAQGTEIRTTAKSNKSKKERYANFFDFFDLAVHFLISPISRRYPASPRHPQITRIHNQRNLRNQRTIRTSL
ncbi:MAG: hypothetical protein LBK61_04465 [Spirochaetaceae bacterium]|jgi:hypothetical protein|nr:hypothetical protein [Spirochaetaceae bacterium]